MKPNKPKKAPSKPETVPSDNFALEVDGETYYPHAGEVVTFRGRQNVGDALLALRLQNLSNESEPARVGEALQQLIEGISQKIISWTWTDDDGNAYPSPPSAEVLTAIGFDELGYLVGGGKTRSQEDDLKNA